ncbi:MAG: response regulator [Ectothiorhodospiraceae bacterium]|nr:response regulator [Ectothiorhodospiraceae bacterium]
MTNILIVDDSPTEIHVLTSMLEKHGFSVATANNGEEGVDKAKSDKPDLILMDVVMPGMNGFQAARQIANDPETNNIPIIIVSTKDQETDKMWGLRQGAKDYVTKPAQEKELISKINSLLHA